MGRCRCVVGTGIASTKVRVVKSPARHLLLLVLFVEVPAVSEKPNGMDKENGTIVSFKKFSEEKKLANKKANENSITEEDTDSWSESIKKRNAEIKNRLSQKRKSSNKQVLSSYRIK